MGRMKYVAAVVCATALYFQAASPAGETLWIMANGWRLKAQVYRSVRSSGPPVLAVVLHGDLLGVRAVPQTTYHYDFASDAAVKIDSLVVAALLRPGYRDHTGERSDGEVGQATGDNYTPEVVDAIAEAIDQLKAKFHPARTVLAGHSGGAAITGNLVGRWPATVDGAFMLSCPCDLAAWRRHMQQMQNNAPIWSAPIRGLSPLELADKVQPSVPVRMLVGSADDVPPPDLSRRYAQALRSSGRDVTIEVLPDLGHEILDKPATLDAFANFVARLREK
jgi:pimeloyl-ACP methyl ester carboxylesterase